VSDKTQPADLDRLLLTELDRRRPELAKLAAGAGSTESVVFARALDLGLEAIRVDLSGMVRYGSILIGTSGIRCEVGGKPLPLPNLEYGVLLALVRAQGNYVSRLELFESAWHASEDLGNTLDNRIAGLRVKLRPFRIAILNNKSRGFALILPPTS